MAKFDFNSGGTTPTINTAVNELNKSGRVFDFNAGGNNFTSESVKNLKQGTLSNLPQATLDTLKNFFTPIVEMYTKPEEDILQAEKILLGETKKESTFSKVLNAPIRTIGKAFTRTFGPMVNPLAKDIGQMVASNELSTQVANGQMPPEVLDDIEVLKKTVPQIVGDVSQAVLAAYMPSFAGESVGIKSASTLAPKLGKFFGNEITGKVLAPTALERIGTGFLSGGKAGALFGTASALSSGTKDPKEFAEIVGETIFTLTTLGGITAGTSVALGKLKELPAQLKNERVKKLVEDAIKVAEEKGGQVGPKGVLGKTVEYAATQLSGLSMDTIRKVIADPEAFSPENLALLSPESLAIRVQKAIEKLGEQRSDTGSAYNAIRDAKTPINIKSADIMGVFDRFGVKFDELGKIIESKDTAPLTNTDIGILQKFKDLYLIEEAPGVYRFDSNSFLNARASLSAMGKYDSMKGTVPTALARVLRYEFDKFAPAELKALDKKYAPERKLYDKLRRDYFNADGTLKDNAVTKITNLTNKGREVILSRLEKIVPGIGRDIGILKAMQDIEAAKGHKVGTYVKAGVTGGLIGTGNLPGAIMLGIISQPALFIPILRAFGRFKGIKTTRINEVINKLKKGEALTKAELKLAEEAVTEYDVRLNNVVADKDLIDKRKQDIIENNLKKERENSGKSTMPAEDLPAVTGQTGKPRKYYPGLTPELRAKELSAFEKLDKMGIDKAYEELKKDPESRGGKLLNPDDIRPIVHDNVKHGPYKGTEAASVHEPSSEVANVLKERKIAEIKPGDTSVWTIGGPGHGKGSAIRHLMPELFDKMKFGYDSVLGNIEKSTNDFNAVLKNGGKIVAPFVFRNIIDAWKEGVIGRAKSKGRTVPATVFLEGTESAWKNVISKVEEFKNQRLVKIPLIDNTGKVAFFTDIDAVKKLDYTNLKDKWLAVLEKETQKLFDEGLISKEILDGLLLK